MNQTTTADPAVGELRDLLREVLDAITDCHTPRDILDRYPGGGSAVEHQIHEWRVRGGLEDPAPETMTVTVRDRSREAPWGVGVTTPVTRKITISAFCPRCGQRRGEPQGLNQCDDGAWYWVQVWTNPCGHLDMYEDVLSEADAMAIDAAEAHRG